MLEGLFGNPTVEKVLWYLTQYEEGYAQEISETLSVPVTTVKNTLLRLENGGIIVGHLIGRSRVFRLNPRWPMLKELTDLLEKSLEYLPRSYIEETFRKRKRPRRKDKPL